MSPLLLKNRAFLSMKREQKEAGNLEHCFIFLAEVIQAHVKKVKHRAVTIVIKQKQGQEETPSQLWPQESLSCPRELAGHCTSPTGNSCHPRGRQGGNFPP